MLGMLPDKQHLRVGRRAANIMAAAVTATVGAAATASDAADVKQQQPNKTHPQTLADGGGAAAAAAGGGSGAADDAEAKKRDWAYDFTRGVSGVVLPPLYIIDAYVVDNLGQRDVTAGARAMVKAHPSGDLDMPRGDDFYKALGVSMPDAAPKRTAAPVKRQFGVTYIHTHTPLPVLDPHAADVDLKTLPHDKAAAAADDMKRRVRAAIDAAQPDVRTAIADIDADDLFIAGVSLPGAPDSCDKLPCFDRVQLLYINCDHLPDPNTLMPFKPYIVVRHASPSGFHGNAYYRSTGTRTPDTDSLSVLAILSTRDAPLADTRTGTPTAPTWPNLSWAFSQPIPERTCHGQTGTSVMLPVSSSDRGRYTFDVYDKSLRGKAHDTRVCGGELRTTDIWRRLAAHGKFGPITLSVPMTVVVPNKNTHNTPPAAHFTFAIKFAPETLAAAAAGHNPDAMKEKAASAAANKQQEKLPAVAGFEAAVAAAAAPAAAPKSAVVAAPHTPPLPPPQASAPAAADASFAAAVSVQRNAAPPEETP